VHWGTAVNVQAMVFGNRGDRSATGVAFTRDRRQDASGSNGEFLVNAQGETLSPEFARRSRSRSKRRAVAKENGIPSPAGKEVPSLAEVMPDCYRQLLKAPTSSNATIANAGSRVHDRERQALHAADPNGKRTARAAVRIAVEMEGEKLINRELAVKRVLPEQVDQLLHPTIDPRPTRSASPAGWERRPAPPPVSSCSRQRMRSRKPRKGTRSCSFVSPPRPRTSPAWSPPKGSSPPPADARRMRGGRRAHGQVLRGRLRRAARRLCQRLDEDR